MGKVAVRAVLRGSEVLWTEPPEAEVLEEVTDVRRALRVIKSGEEGEYRYECLEDNSCYVAHKKIFDELDREFSRFSEPSKLLLYGPPGTGKSYAPRFFARKWGWPIRIATPADVLSKYVGETEERIKKLIEEAQSEYKIVLFDEAEAFLQRRAFGEHEEVLPFQTLLTLLNELERGKVVATTNVPLSHIDAAMLRGGRFTAIPYPMPPPEALQLYARLIGKEYKPCMLSFADVKAQKCGAVSQRWYQLITPVAQYNIKLVYNRREVKTGVFAVPYPFHILYSFFRFAFGRIVWWVNSPQADLETILQMAEDYAAVVWIDARVVSSKLVLKPARNSLVLVQAPVQGIPTAQFSVDEDILIDTFYKAWLTERPQCAPQTTYLSKTEKENVIMLASWGAC